MTEQSASVSALVSFLAPQGFDAREKRVAFIDAHHHIWRQADLPWLMGPMQPRIFGPYEAIRRDYPAEEFLADAGADMAASVYVQPNWPVDKALEEVEWVEAEAVRAGIPHAIVSYADLRAPDVGDLLDAQRAASRRLRGVRMQLHWHENELYRFAERPNLADDADFRRGLAALAPRGLLFELQVFAGQMAGAARLAADFPDTQFVLMHCGMPEDLSEDGMATWRRGMALLAECPNVAVKHSGLGTFIHRVDIAHIRAIALATIDCFGVDRCLWGSNFPIEKLWTSYADLLGAWREALNGLSHADRQAVFHDNAARLYDLA
jgi:predicted TIM-barrel fold metal-dependent hydrolase